MFEKRNVIEYGRTPQQEVDGVKTASIDENVQTRAADTVKEALLKSSKRAGTSRGTDARLNVQ